MSITDIPLETTSETLYIEGLNGKEVYYISVATPFVLANTENVCWTEFWVGKNTVGTIIGVDIFKKLEAELVLGCNNTIVLSQAGPHRGRRYSSSRDRKQMFIISKFPNVWAKDKFDCGFAKIQPLSIPGPIHDAK